MPTPRAPTPAAQPAGLRAARAGARRPRLARRPHRGAHRPRRRRRRPGRSRRLGRPRGRRPPAPGRLDRVDAADPDARRGRPAPAGRAPPRRRVPGHGRLAARRVEPQGVDRATCSRPAARPAAGCSSPTSSPGPADDDGAPAGPIARHYRCTVCRDQRGGTEQRHGAARAEDLARALSDAGAARGARPGRATGSRWSTARRTSSTSCSTCTRRASSSALAGDHGADRGRPAGGAGRSPRSGWRCSTRPPVEPARDRPAGAAAAADRRRPRQAAGRRPSGASATRGWRSRTAFRLVRGFVQRLEGGALGPVQARLGEDLRASRRAPRRPSSRSPARRPSVRSRDGDGLGRAGSRPSRGSGSCSASRRCARASTASPRPTTGRPGPWAARRPRCCPIEPWPTVAARAVVVAGRRRSAGRWRRSSRRWPATVGSSSSWTAAPRRSRRSPSAAASAGYRVVVARLAEPGRRRRRRRRAGAARRRPCRPGRGRGPTSRCPPSPGGAGDPDRRARAAACSPRRSGSTSGRSRRADAARVVTDAAVETLRARGEPARFERLFGEILVGLDRSGQLRRLVDRRAAARTDARRPTTAHGAAPRAGPTSRPDARARRRPTGRPAAGAPAATAATAARRSRRRATLSPTPRRTRSSACWRSSATSSPGPTSTRLTRDRARPLVAGRPRRPRRRRAAARRPRRVGRLQPPVDRRAAVRDARSSSASPRCSPATTCPTRRSSAPASTATAARPARPTACVTGDDLLRRSQEHTELAGGLADGGHRLGHARLDRPSASRRRAVRRPAATLGDLLDDRERGAYLGGIGRAVDDLAEVDAIWYIRGKVALLFEVEWTAMLGEPLLRRHARIGDGRAARPVPRRRPRADRARPPQARALAAPAGRDGRAAAGTSSSGTTSGRSSPPSAPDLDDLEPLLGLDPVVERGGEQMPLFGG